MPAYAIAHLQDAAPHPEIAEYMERITATFEPYGGRFLVHATPHETREGDWPGHVVVIGFPDITQARTWWDSPPTSRSPLSAPATSRATSSWSRESPPTTTPRPRQRPYGPHSPPTSRPLPARSSGQLGLAGQR